MLGLPVRSERRRPRRRDGTHPRRPAHRAEAIVRADRRATTTSPGTTCSPRPTPGAHVRTAAHRRRARRARTRAEPQSAAFAGILHWRAGYYQPHYAPDPLTRGAPDRARPEECPCSRTRARAVAEAVHPVQRLRALVDAGLFGLEIDHRENTPTRASGCTTSPRRFDLVVTGSSDYHGEGKPNRLGENTTDPGARADLAEATGPEPGHAHDEWCSGAGEPRFAARRDRGRRDGDGDAERCCRRGAGGPWPSWVPAATFASAAVAAVAWRRRSPRRSRSPRTPRPSLPPRVRRRVRDARIGGSGGRPAASPRPSPRPDVRGAASLIGVALRRPFDPSGMSRSLNRCGRRRVGLDRLRAGPSRAPG